MGALFDDGPGFHHEDMIGGLDGGEAVGDDKAGTAGHHFQKGGLNIALGEGVHRTGGFIED